MRNKIKTRRPAYHPEAIQIASMSNHYPSFKYFLNKDRNLVFTGKLQPKITMPIYTVRVEFRGDAMPKVKIISPVLVDKPPHFHHTIGCICLYKPENFNWTATKPISNYILPWTSCWIYFYEVWKGNGNIWLGPEAQHDPNIKKHE